MAAIVGAAVGEWEPQPTQSTSACADTTPRHRNTSSASPSPPVDTGAGIVDVLRLRLRPVRRGVMLCRVRPERRGVERRAGEDMRAAKEVEEECTASTSEARSGVVSKGWILQCCRFLAWASSSVFDDRQQ